MKQKLFIVKIGGSLIDDEVAFNQFLEHFSQIKEQKILIHGGGKLANQMADRLSIPQKMIDGRRVTDKATLDIVTMVYAGNINKNIVSKLQGFGSNAVGFSGADANLIRSKKRDNQDVDFGFVGDVDKSSVNAVLISQFLDLGLIPTFSAITHNGEGSLLNTNADTVASVVAQAMSEFYDCELLYCFNKDGVLEDVNQPESLVKKICKKDFIKLQQENKLNKGILPKIENAIKAKEQGVSEVALINENKLQLHIKNHNEGTTICL